MTPHPLTASTVSNHVSGVLHGADRPLSGISTIVEPVAGRLTFVNDPVKHHEAFTEALRVGAVILIPDSSPLPALQAGTLIAVENPRGAFAAAVEAFFKPRVEAGIAATAVVHATASVDPSAHVGEFSVIGEGVTVGAHSEIRNHVVIGANVQLGRSTLIKSHAVIGEEGFGIDKDAQGNNFRLPHLGSVRIGDHVEVGNFTTVCSGTIAPTVIGDYTKIDDHVHVSHNCRVGKNVIITACAEISGSVVIEDDVWIGPNASMIQGITVGANALIGIGAVVTKSIPGNEVQFGNPARRIRDNS